MLCMCCSNCMVCWCVSLLRLFLFFFFKQKTAYEMRISDWSSDVCSSDLVRVLQLAGEIAAIEAGGAVHLAERGGGRRLVLEGLEPRLPAGAELAAHTALHEGPAHRRRVGLELAQFLGVLARQGIGNGGEDLRRLHQRPLEAAERRLQLRGK